MEIEFCFCLPLISPICSLVCLFWLCCVSVFMYFVKDCSAAAFNDEIIGSVLLINEETLFFPSIHMRNELLKKLSVIQVRHVLPVSQDVHES